MPNDMRPGDQLTGAGASARFAQLRANLGPLFDSLVLSSQAFFIADLAQPDQPLIFANQAFETLTGFPLAEVLGRNCRFLQTPRTDAEAVARMRAAVAERRPITVELLNRRKSGEPFWTCVNITPLADPTGELTLSIAMLEDITSVHARDEIAAELEEARERLRLIRTMAGAAGAWEWDVANDRLHGDARFAELYGLDPLEAVSGTPSSAFFAPVHDDDKMRVRIGVAGIMHGADVFARDYRLVRPNGEVRWVSARGSAERDADYRTVRFRGVLADITEQKHLEERLRVAQTAGSVGTFEYVSGFGTVGVSAEFCRLLGLMPSEALPVPTVNSVVHPEDPPLIGGARPGAADASYREFRIARANDGEARWIARRGEHRREGHALGDRFLGVIYDITTLKQAEQRLRDFNSTLEERVRERTEERDRVWNNSRDLLVVLDSDARLHSVSPAWTEVMGHKRHDVVDHPFLDFVAPEDAAAMQAALSRAAAGEELTNFETRMIAEDGSARWIAWHTSSERDLVYGYGRDITESKAQAEALRETEDQLRQAQKMEAVGQLTGGIAHDFNNMLTGVIGGLDMVRRRLSEGRTADIDRYLEAAVTSAERAATLTHRLLAFSRRQSLDPSPVDLPALVGSMADLLRRTLGERVVLEVISHGPPWPARTDVNQVESAILNLAINARDAMPNGGRLIIETSAAEITASGAPDGVAPGDYAVISVTDTGEGMPPDVVAKAFDPFFTTKPIGQGTGLGLSMIYGFVQQTKGHVAIESELGVGTSVKLFLPRDISAEEAPELAADPTQPIPRGAGQTVLVVEDDPSVRLLVVEVLRELGYAAIEAPDSSGAIPILTSSVPIGLLITDVGLPGLNGRQLAEIARLHRPELPVLFLTGYAAAAAARSELLGERMDVAFKPFALDGLAQAIRKMLAA
ncbi:MAG TPA: PAS domain S-box protein [Caulobacteraceae bacterium]|nr:PAS domain S-box protein [Caulobacteraceae bacterium]